MTTPILSVSSLYKRFGGLVAVDNCTFEVQEGEILGIIGPNGAGKTTLFNALTGFLKIDEGEIRLRGRPVHGQRPHEVVNLGMARTFQVMKPYYEMTVMETLQVSSYCKRIRSRYADEREIEIKNRELLSRLALDEYRDTLVDELPQGELRLLDVGRALATEPEVLFLDEPFSGLGTDAAKKLTDLLTSLKAEGLTIVIIEHRLRELMKLASKVMAINFGQTLALGTPEEVLSNPAVIEAYLGASGSNAVAVADQ